LLIIDRSPEKVDDLMASIEDQLAIHTEISDAISQSFGTVYDEDELDAELQALEEENLTESLGAVHVPQEKVCAPSLSPSSIYAWNSQRELMIA
jgi:hypothetical protein